MKGLVKRLLFGSEVQPRAIWFGPAAGVRLWIDPAHKSQRILGLDEREIIADFRRLATAARGFLDIGASDGYYCVLARKFNPSIRAIGCDAGAEWAVAAERNYDLNFSDHRAGLSWQPVFVGNEAGQLTLDELARELPAPVFVKIDVDGHELSVLDSGKALLAAPGTTWLIETHAPELETGCIERLAQHGYACRVIDHAWWRALVPERRIVPHNRWLIAERL